MRPISSDLRFLPVRAASSDLTAGRRDGVGGPTIGRWSPHQSGRLHDDGSAPAMTDAQPLPTAALLREAIDTALDSLDALELQARDAARRFRRHAIDDAQHGLAQLVESTQTLLKLAAMTAGASGTDIETLCAEHDIAAERATHAALSAMIGRQLEHDWHGLARVIEQPFTAALHAWRAVFLALDGTTGPCGTAA
ncbi:MAG: hypothetical protein IT183_12405 [Acidobacteria bacterium]|nr:hypothetical protein [Acidobacteriota bacterium]